MQVPTTQPIARWAEKRQEAIRRAETLRSEQLLPPRVVPKSPVHWRQAPTRPSPRTATKPNLMISHSTGALLEQSFPTKRVRPASAGVKPTRLFDGDAFEQQLQDELDATGRVVSGVPESVRR